MTEPIFKGIDMTALMVSLKNLKLKPHKDIDDFPTKLKFEYYEKFPFSQPKESDFVKAFGDLKFKDYLIGGNLSEKQRFQPMQGYLYHGTSLTALKSILEDGFIYPAINLIKQKRLVSGELEKDLREFGDEARGPKFMSRAKLIEAGIIKADYERIYDFGHAFDVCFGLHPVTASSYVAKDPNEAAIIGLDRKLLEMHGHSFLNGKSEGILHEGPVPICLSLKQLLVPDNRVEEFREITDKSYLAKVFPYSEFRDDFFSQK